jgi:hypothetical protein
MEFLLATTWNEWVKGKLKKMRKKNNFDLISSVKIVVTPWEKGFSCGIITDPSSKMTAEQYELCSTIARGMINYATKDPHNTFLLGVKGYAEDRNEKKNKDDKIIDFLDKLKSKRNRELSKRN